MDHTTPRERDFEGDIEGGLTVSEEESIKVPVLDAKNQERTLLEKICGGFIDGPIKSEDKESSCGGFSNSNGFSPENVKTVSNKILERVKAVDYVEITPVKEKRKKSSNKKPPRPPRGPSLDAADHKLIKEISELAMLKRARIERMKALKKMKTAKSSSSNSSSIFAMVLTVLFCLVIIFQGMSSGRNLSVNFQGSAGPTEGSLISVQYNSFSSASEPNEPRSGSPNLVEKMAGSDPSEKLMRLAG